MLVPFWSSLLVRTYAWQVILRDTGLINSTLQGWGLIDQPLDLYQTTTGVLLGMTQILLPFMVLPLFTTMARIDPELTKAAANLGASPTRAFLRVFLPLSIPGVLAGSLLVFVLALGFYITPALLGSPQGHDAQRVHRDPRPAAARLGPRERDGHGPDRGHARSCCSSRRA